MVKDLLQLFRWKNLIIAGGTVILTKYAIFEPAIRYQFPLSHSTLNFWETLLLAISVMLIAAGGYVINDINDVVADKVNKPDEVLVGDKISFKLANTIYISLNIIGLLLAAYTGSLAGNYKLALLHVIVASLLWIYAVYVKNSFLIGNILVAVASALVPVTYFFFESLGYIQVYGDVLVLNYNSLLGGPLNTLYLFSVGLAFFGFFISLIREIIKDVQDYSGDFKVGARTIPIVLGEKTTNVIIIALSLALISILVYVLHFKISTPPFNGIAFVIYVWSLVTIPIGGIIYTVLKAKEYKDYQLPSNICKFVMATGILTTLIYSFNV